MTQDDTQTFVVTVSRRNYFVSTELLSTVSLHPVTDMKLGLVTAPDVNMNDVL